MEDTPSTDDALAAQELTIDEYCARRSKTDRRVELLGAFHADEVANKRQKDFESAFDSRLQVFATKPV